VDLKVKILSHQLKVRTVRTCAGQIGARLKVWADERHTRSVSYGEHACRRGLTV
jgi:hypothetical protein